MLITVVFFILLLGVLVLAHEWGHFIVARIFGVKVEEFAFGFPPRLFSVTRRGTRYALNLFPLGGYVKIFGEDGEGESRPESFSSRSLLQRLGIIAAGVAMNVILAWVLFSLGHAFGLPTVLDDGAAANNVKVTIVGISSGSPAEASGLRFGDAIQEISAKDPLRPRSEASRRGEPSAEKIKIERIEDVQQFVAAHRGEELAIIALRGEDTITMNILARAKPPQGEGALGIAMARVGIVRSPWWRAPWDGLKTTASATAAITTALFNTVRDVAREGKVSADISGPVGIFVFTNETRSLGLTYLLELAGILSLNLALLNILPVPALDGGRILFLFIEGIRGVRLNQRLEQAIHTVGFAVLLLLMAAITYRDIVRVF